MNRSFYAEQALQQAHCTLSVFFVMESAKQAGHRCALDVRHPFIRPIRSGSRLLKRWMKSRGTHKGRGLVGYRPVWKNIFSLVETNHIELIYALFSDVGGRDFADLLPGNSLTRLTQVLQITHCPFWLVIPPHHDLGMGLFILTLGWQVLYPVNGK